MGALSLISGLSIEEPLRRLTKFCENEYVYYDAVPKGDANHVEPVDVLATVGINSCVAGSIPAGGTIACRVPGDAVAAAIAK